MPKKENNKDVVQRKEPKSEVQKNGTNYLLVIGIDEYKHCPFLYNAVKDAKEIVNVLQTSYRFESDNIITLYNEEATEDNINQAFLSFIKKIKIQDNFIVYFSGHGVYDEVSNKGYWVPVNARSGVIGDYNSNSDIRDFLDAIKSHHTFIMVDSCHSGTLFNKGVYKNLNLKKSDLEYYRQIGRDSSRWGLTAGRNEIVTDGEPGTNSPFAKSILDQLKESTQPIGVEELCINVVKDVIKAVSKDVSGKCKQTPRGEPLKIDGHDGGQFVFHPRKGEVNAVKKKKEIEPVLTLISPISKEVQPSRLKPSLFEKYGKYLLLLLIPILGYCFYLYQYEKPIISSLPVEQIFDVREGQIIDIRDGEVYKWIRLEDGKKWMVQNLNYKTSDSWCYNDKSSNCTKYGRLYTWQAAKKACPLGWRLPTDDEWWEMSSHYGKAINVYPGQIINEEKNAGKVAYENLIKGGVVGFSAVLSGYRRPDSVFVYPDRTDYWSRDSSIHNSSKAWYYGLRRDRNYFGRDSTSMSFGFSCRCLRD